MMAKKIISFLMTLTCSVGTFAATLPISLLGNTTPVTTVVVTIKNHDNNLIEHIHADEYSRNYTKKSETVPATASSNKDWIGVYDITLGVDSLIEIVGDNNFMVQLSTVADKPSVFCMPPDFNENPSSWDIIQCKANKVGSKIIVNAEVDPS